MDRDSKRKPKIAITCGDPNGVGPEVLMKALCDPRLLQEATFIVFAPVSALTKWKKEEAPIVQIKNTNEGSVGKLNVLPYTEKPFEATPGAPTPSGGRVALWGPRKSEGRT